MGVRVMVRVRIGMGVVGMRRLSTVYSAAGVVFRILVGGYKEGLASPTVCFILRWLAKVVYVHVAVLGVRLNLGDAVEETVADRMSSVSMIWPALSNVKRTQRHSPRDLRHPTSDSVPTRLHEGY